jgi:hypothetical protein
MSGYVGRRMIFYACIKHTHIYIQTQTHIPHILPEMMAPSRKKKNVEIGK